MCQLKTRDTLLCLPDCKETAYLPWLCTIPVQVSTVPCSLFLHSQLHHSSLPASRTRCDDWIVARAMSYSIHQQLQGSSVLLTGATGYVGSLVLEALLRTTDVAEVYVLLRPSSSMTPEGRCQQLLAKNLFHKVRDCPHIVNKVRPIAGDLQAPQLGLTTANQSQLSSTIHIIIHCAADIRLELDIQTSLRSNYCGTDAVLQLARQCQQLRAMVHVSSAYVNMNQPRHSVVDEVMYPLQYGHQPADAAALVQELLLLPPAAAQDRASALAARWGFPNNYTLGKHLTEQLVAAARVAYRLPLAIVRPSLVAAVAKEPLPGYIGNFAGPIGASAAMAIGLYHSLSCVSSQPLHVWDAVPGDIVAAVVLATAAAVAAGVDGAIAAAGAAQRAAGGTTSSGSSNSSCAAGGAQKAPSTASKPPPPAAAAAAGDVRVCSGDILIVHAATSSSYPVTLMEGWNHAVEFMEQHPPRFRISRGLLPRMTPSFRPDPAVVAWHRRWTRLKVLLLSWVLRLLGRARSAQRLVNAFQALTVIGTSKTDKDLTFSTHACAHLEAALAAEERQQYMLMWRPPAVQLTGLSHEVPTGAGGGRSLSAAAAATPATAAAGAAGTTVTAGQGAESGMTWRRFNHTQMAAVYSALFQVGVPQAKGGTGEVLHDFRYIR